MPSKHPSEYTQAEVNVWLNSVGLGNAIDIFQANGIDGRMLVTLTEADLTGDLGLSGLQARKFAQSLEFASDLAEAGGGDSYQMQALAKENARLKEEIASLTMINKELQAQLAPELSSARAPAPAYAPAPAPAYVPAPAPAYAPAPAPKHHSGPPPGAFS